MQAQCMIEGTEMNVGINSQANQPSSSSLREGAGRGAPAPSVVGSRSAPSLPQGFSDLMDESRPVCWEVSTGTSALRDQPSEFIESLNEEDAMISVVLQ